jgi:hypothetical protein
MPTIVTRLQPNVGIAETVVRRWFIREQLIECMRLLSAMAWAPPSLRHGRRGGPAGAPVTGHRSRPSMPPPLAVDGCPTVDRPKACDLAMWSTTSRTAGQPSPRYAGCGKKSAGGYRPLLVTPSKGPIVQSLHVTNHQPPRTARTLLLRALAWLYTMPPGVTNQA